MLWPNAAGHTCLDDYATAGTAFPTCTSSSSWNVPAHLTIFIGLDPAKYGWVYHGDVGRLDKHYDTMARILSRNGLRTAAFTGGRRCFSKCPPGLPVIAAAAYRLFGPAAALRVDLVMASLSLLAVFLICRLWIGDGRALLRRNPNHPPRRGPVLPGHGRLRRDQPAAAARHWAIRHGRGRRCGTGRWCQTARARHG